MQKQEYTTPKNIKNQGIVSLPKDNINPTITNQNGM